MEGASGEVAYPSIEQIIEVNRRMIDEFGGLFLELDNLLNRSSLEYILEAIKSSLFGIKLYPTLVEKASALIYHMTTRHVFNDGNKRTSVHVAWEFLQANGVDLALDRTIIDIIVGFEEGKVGETELSEWLNNHIM